VLNKMAYKKMSMKAIKGMAKSSKTPKHLKTWARTQLRRRRK